MKFNTERQYSAEGQIIHAIQLDAERVHFVDVTRNIYGVLRCEFNQKSILQAYDAGDYDANYLDINEQIALNSAARELINTHMG